MRVDAHHHLWDLKVRDQPWTVELPGLRQTFDAAELRPHLRRHKIDATVLVQTLARPDETAALLAVAAANPFIAGVVGWADLKVPDISGSLAALQDSPEADRLVGIRHLVQDESDPQWLCRPDVRRGLQAIGAAGLVYDLLLVPEQLPAAVSTAQALPDVQFVLDHAGKPRIASRAFAPWQFEVRRLAKLPNVAVKLSGLVTEAESRTWTVGQLRPYVDTLLDAFGPQRIMFGSDWPVCQLAAGYDEVVDAAEQLTAELSSSEVAQVFGETACRWYGINR
jgi:L-fuconolactonase